MKYLSKKVFLIAMTATVAIAGCKKNFLDVNDDPNRVTDQNITPELLFPQAAHAVGARVASTNFTFLDNWLGYWAPSGTFALDRVESSYNVSFGFGEAIWQNNYNVLFDLYQVKTRAIAKGDSVLAGASMILSAKLWQEMVDMFGDIPYTQAFNNFQYRQPAYDKAKDVYASVQRSLDTAVSYMKKTPRTTFGTEVDIVNHGNTTKWIKFANTLRLRILIRQSEVNPTPTDQLVKINNDGGVLHQGESVNVNPTRIPGTGGYVNETNKQSPFYANYGLTPTGAEANTITRANTYFVNLLTNTGDPRLTRFFRVPASGGSTIVGNVYGSTTNPPGNNTSTIGVGLANNASQDQWIYPSFESMFLEAEAIARGWITGDAKKAYEAAVTESFVWLGVPSATTAADTYLHSNASSASIANWANAGSTVASQVKFIVYQKYISLAGVDALEAWSDQRRLHFLPDNGYLSVLAERNLNGLPNRLPYPQTEYTTNAANVNAEGSINLYTSKIFWQP